METEQRADLTCGDYQTEPESVAALRELLEERSDLFRVYHEVWGWLLHPRPKCEKGRMRIDMVVMPQQPLIDAGWTHGPFGIECKKSGMKIGRPICQCLDYSRTVFELPSGYQVMLDWSFIWPLAKQHGPIASVMSQNRIGTAYYNRWSGLCFGSDSQVLLQVPAVGTPEVSSTTTGRKVGSR